MKKFTALVGVLSLATFCSTARSSIIPFTATLDVAQATTAGPGATGSGNGTFTLDDVTGLFSFNITFSGLSAPESASHVHGPALPGVATGIQFGLPPGSLKIGSTTLSAAQQTDLLNDLYYVNIHSSAFPGGEIRGQIAVVPEPTTVALLAGGMALAACRRRRRNK